jgi:hypothetical protein
MVYRGGNKTFHCVFSYNFCMWLYIKNQIAGHLPYWCQCVFVWVCVCVGRGLGVEETVDSGKTLPGDHLTYPPAFAQLSRESDTLMSKKPKKHKQRNCAEAQWKDLEQWFHSWTLSPQAWAPFCFAGKSGSCPVPFLPPWTTCRWECLCGKPRHQG